MTIGEKIRNYRKVAGLTQKRLGELCGVATGTVQQYELGKRQPRIEQLQKIADVLKVQITDLINDYYGDPEGVSPEHPIAFPGLEKMLFEIGYGIGYGCDYIEYDDNAIWINCPGGKQIPVTLEELETLNNEAEIYLKFRVENLTKNKRPLSEI